MESKIIDIVLCAVIYGILIGFIFTRNMKRGRGGDTDGDDDGGLPVITPPDFDLPPGVCLPDDGPKLKQSEPEEIFV